MEMVTQVTSLTFDKCSFALFFFPFRFLDFFLLSRICHNKQVTLGAASEASHYEDYRVTALALAALTTKK